TRPFFILYITYIVAKPTPLRICIIKRLVILFQFIEIAFVPLSFFKTIKICRQLLRPTVRIVVNMDLDPCPLFYMDRELLIFILFITIRSIPTYTTRRKIHFIFFSLGQERIKPFLSFLS